MHYLKNIIFILLSLLLSFNQLYALSISGTIFEDISADALADGDTNLTDTLGDQVAKNGTKIYLYLDNGDNVIDTNDTLVSSTDTDVLGDGKYSFNSLAAGKYYVVVDSLTMPPNQTYTSSGTISDVWAEQTYGPQGGLCDDGSGTTIMLTSAGTCYGGKQAGISDNPSDITTSEHIAIVDINATDISGVDFGFSFNCVTHTEDNDDDPLSAKSSQGSFRQFIQNANAISGVNVMRFVPKVPMNNPSWWSITLNSALPVISDIATVINGTAYKSDASFWDANSGSSGHGGSKVGIGADGLENSSDEVILNTFFNPELQIDANDMFTNNGTTLTNYLIPREGVFVIDADDTEILNLAITNASYLGDDTTDDEMAAILIRSGNNIYIADNFIGVNADGSAPAVTLGVKYGIFQENNSVIAISHNYFAYTYYTAICSGNNSFIYKNDFYQASNLPKGDAITTEYSNGGNILIENNRIEKSSAYAIDSYNSASIVTISDNTIISNGQDVSAANNGENGGIRIYGQNNIIRYNLITANTSSGIIITKDGSGNKITKNSIYQNGAISIDLDMGSSENGDGISANDGALNTSAPNDGIDTPIITSANLIGTNLYLKGYVGSTTNQSTFANASIEVYKVDDDGDTNGEGRWYLGSCSADANGNIDCLIVSTLISAGDYISATATDINNNTSEFGPNTNVTDSVPFSCDQNAYVFYSTADDTPTEVNEIDLLNASQSTLSTDIYPVNINAIGYSVTDDFIWGYDIINHKITKTDANLDTISYDIAGLDPYKFHLGDVSTDGILYIASSYLKKIDGVESDGILRLYRIDVNPSSATYLQELPSVTLSDQSLYAADFAFHPNDNKLYFAEKYSGHLYKVDPASGAVTDIGYLGLGTDVDSHVQFFDKNGYFYFYKDNRFYRCDLTDPSNPNPNAVRFISMVLPKNGDGARCAYASMGDKPIILINDAAAIYEGHSGTGSITLEIYSDRPIPTPGGLNIDYTLTDGSATIADNDYIAINSSINIPQGATKATLTLPVINGDLEIESDEDFFINFSSPDAYFIDSVAQATILNDDYNITLNASTSGSPLTDGNLTTQIVNKNFNLTISAYNETLTKPAEDMNITKITLLDGSSNILGTLFSGAVTIDSTGLASVNVNITKAYKIASLQIEGTFLGRTYTGKSKDSFAIRPKVFLLTIPNDNVAAKAFNIEIKALDELNNPTQGYNENAGTSFDINFTEQIPTCATGTMNLSGISFSNGEVDYNTSYNEVGKLDFIIKENTGSEFAIIDENDTADIDRLIPVGTANNISFKIDRFELDNYSLNNGSTNFTFYADFADLEQMASKFNIRLRALNANGNITKNYSKGCYSHDTNLKIKFDANASNTDTHTLVWRDDNNATHANGAAYTFQGNKQDIQFDFDIDKGKFESGENNTSININFSRDEHIAKEPLKLAIKDINATDASGGCGFKIETKSIDYYYGRLYIPDSMAVGNTLNANIFYEIYCKSCDKSLFPMAKTESVDNINWYIVDNPYDGQSGFSGISTTNNNFIVTNTTLPQNSITVTTLSAVTNGIDEIVFKVPSNKLPLKDRVSYIPEPWLTYKPFNLVKSKQIFSIDLAPKPNEWAGKGDTGLSVDMNMSGRKDTMKMDW